MHEIKYEMMKEVNTTKFTAVFTVNIGRSYDSIL